MNKNVNRYLNDKTMDHIDHALGRPVNPLAETNRNYFYIGVESETGKGFDASPFWERGSKVHSDGMAYYFVTDEGRKALVQHLKEIGDPHRLYDVTYRGTTHQVVAESAPKAKYHCWLETSDSRPDLTFGMFQRAASVRLTADSTQSTEAA